MKQIITIKLNNYQNIKLILVVLNYDTHSCICMVIFHYPTQFLDIITTVVQYLKSRYHNKTVSLTGNWPIKCAVRKPPWDPPITTILSLSTMSISNTFSTAFWRRNILICRCVFSVHKYGVGENGMFLHIKVFSP